MYHRITLSEIDPWGMCVSPENFSQQLESLSTLGTPMSLTDFVAAQETGSLPDGAIAITFDDGYVDNFTNAFPLLEKHGIPSTIFVTTGNIDSDREFWWDELESMLLKPSVLPEHLDLQVANAELHLELENAAWYNRDQLKQDRATKAWEAKPDTRMHFFYQVWKFLWPLEPTTRAQLMCSLRDWSKNDSAADTSRRTLTSNELRELGMSPLLEIGAHTSDHSPLNAHGQDYQRKEIQVCQQTLIDILDKPIKSFAYPHGEYGDETIEILQELGFDCALIVAGRQVTLETHRMLLPRFGVENMDRHTFERQFKSWQKS